MNLILFEEEELDVDLPYDDHRVIHIRDILKLGEGDVFAAGIIGGRIGKARLITMGPIGWKWNFIPMEDSLPLKPLTLVLGCPRPPVAKRLLKDMSSIGLKEIRSCSTDLNENSYLTSKLWREGLWRNAVIEGAVQGGSTLLPAVRTCLSLERALDDLPVEAVRIALDNSSELSSFGKWSARFSEAVLAIGPERGWSDRERNVLDARGFVRLHLGRRVLRTETACSFGTALLLSAMNSLD
jgi:16S rRNA (uracil1498-N3)-methyltransferase